MAYLSNFLIQIAPKKSKYSNMAYSSNLLLLTHQNGDLLILKNLKLLKYGLFVKFSDPNCSKKIKILQYGLLL